MPAPLRIGETVKLAYVDQSRDSLDASKTVWEEISDGLDNIQVGSYSTSSRGYVGSFQLQGQRPAEARRRVLGRRAQPRASGKAAQERRQRAAAGRTTNDLDVETLRALEQALLDFPGCAVVISHDRWFLDRIATHMLAFEGDSQAVWFEGNYADYVADRRKRLGEDADKPHRIRYGRCWRRLVWRPMTV